MIQPLKNVWMTNIFILISVHLVITNVPTRMFLLCIDGNQKPSSGQIRLNGQKPSNGFKIVSLREINEEPFLSVYLVITDVLRRMS